MEAETILRLIGVLLALAIAIGGLRGRLQEARWLKSQKDRERREREGRDFGGPWSA